MCIISNNSRFFTRITDVPMYDNPNAKVKTVKSFPSLLLLRNIYVLSCSRYSRYYFPRSGHVYPTIFVVGYPARACIEMSSFRANKTEKRKGGIIWIQSFQGWVATPQGVVGGRPWGLPDPHELVPLSVWRTMVILAPNYHHLPFLILLGEGSVK